MARTAAQKQTEVRGKDAASNLGVARVDMKLEGHMIPVSDVERARESHRNLGWTSYEGGATLGKWDRNALERRTEATLHRTA